jgi:hypothetical protein
MLRKIFTLELSYFLFLCADDGTPPDFNYVWENHKQEASCPLTTGYVCAKWTSYYEDTGNIFSMSSFISPNLQLTP